MDIETLKAATLAAKEKAEAAGGADESLNQALKDAEATLAEAEKAEGEGENIDYKKELEEMSGIILSPDSKLRVEKAAKEQRLMERLSS